MNEEEANKKAQEMMVHRSDVFCPLIREECTVLCECYKMPEVVGDAISSRDGSILYRIKHGFCTCYALKGACE